MGLHEAAHPHARPLPPAPRHCTCAHLPTPDAVHRVWDVSSVPILPGLCCDQHMPWNVDLPLNTHKSTPHEGSAGGACVDTAAAPPNPPAPMPKTPPHANELRNMPPPPPPPCHWTPRLGTKNPPPSKRFQLGRQDSVNTKKVAKLGSRIASTPSNVSNAREMDIQNANIKVHVLGPPTARPTLPPFREEEMDPQSTRKEP